MLTQSLEQTAIEQQPKYRNCPSCGEDYLYKARLSATKGIAEPNTAANYCCDEHWMIETAEQEECS